MYVGNFFVFYELSLVAYNTLQRACFEKIEIHV